MTRQHLLLVASLLCVTCKQDRVRPSAVPIHSAKREPHVTTATAPDASSDARAGMAPPAQDSQPLFLVDNSILECVELMVSHEAAGQGFVELQLRGVVRKNVGTCGCKSASIGYRIIRPTSDPFRMEELASKSFNSLKLLQDAFSGKHRVRVQRGQMPLQVQFGCRGEGT